jgi:hypothetical protein
MLSRHQNLFGETAFAMPVSTETRGRVNQFLFTLLRAFATWAA